MNSGGWCRLVFSRCVCRGGVGALFLLLVALVGSLTAIPFWATGPVAAQTSTSPIDFETIPGDMPQEGLTIHEQFVATHGISFELEGGGNPVLAEVGGDVTAFLGPPNNTTPDTPAPGQNIGQYFLTDDGVLNTAPAKNLIIRYDPPTAAASGEILDLDSSETFTIEARDAADTVIQTITLEAGDPGTGDGIATRWAFNRASADIVSLRFIGERPFGEFGLGFDNLNARSAVTGIYLPFVRR